MSNIFKLVIPSKIELAKFYIQQFKYGGIFLHGSSGYELGDGVFLLITLPETNENIAVTGKVCWLSPVSTVGYPAGIEVQFSNDKAGSDAKAKIEIMLGGLLQQQQANYTF